MNKNHAEFPATTACRWSTCTAEFANKDDFLPHLGTHLAPNHLIRRRDPADVAAELLLSFAANGDGSSDSLPYPCKWSQCTTTSSDVDQLVSHVAVEHVSLDEGKRCQWGSCNDHFLTFTELSTHLTIVHVAAGAKVL